MNNFRTRRASFVVIGLTAALSIVAVSCGGDKKAAETTVPATTEAPATSAAPETTAALGTIVDVAVGNADFSILVEAVTAAGLVETLSGPGPFTVFAPTNDAFAAALTALKMTKEQLFADTALLTKILTYHVVPGVVLAADVVQLDGQEVATVQGSKVKVSVMDGKVKINDSNVVATDIMASNGVIHVIDAVLVPAA
ncbi:MAG: fasciclin domain-containing protein [Actinomycetota bacterium]